MPVPATLKSPHLWIIAAIMVGGAVLYYAEYLPGLDNIVAGLPIGAARYPTHRILSLVPVAYGAYVFGFRSGIIITAIISLALLPPALAAADPEPAFEIVAFFVVAVLITWLSYGLRRTATGLKIARQELGSSLQTIKGQQEKLEGLYRISTVVYKTLDTAEIAARALDEVMKVYTVRGGWVCLKDEQSGDLVPAARAGLVPRYAGAPARTVPGDCPDSQVARSDEPLALDSARSASLGIPLEPPGAVIIVPLSTRSGVLGTFGIILDGGHFQPGVVEDLIAIGREIGITIEHSRLHERERLVNEQLRLSEERYRGLFENASEAILICSSAGRVISANRACEQLTGYSQTELIGSSIERYFAGEECGRVKDLFSGKLLAPSLNGELCLIRRDSSSVFVKLKYSPLIQGDAVLGIQIIALDVTEERNLRQNMQFYISQVTRAVEAERLRISRELHDDTAQVLASLSRDLDRLISSEKVPGPAGMRLVRLGEATRAALEGVRRISQDLRPSILDDLGLVPALESIVCELEKYGFTTETVVNGRSRRMPPESELAVFRIAQEALSNVRKHSGGTTVKMTVDFDPDALTVSISDNGKGFLMPPRASDLVNGGKLGIIGMRERARLVGGTLVVNSAPGTGTTITVRIPG